MYSNTTFKTELSNKRKSRGRKKSKLRLTDKLEKSNTHGSKFVPLRAAGGSMADAGKLTEEVGSRSHSKKPNRLSIL